MPITKETDGDFLGVGWKFSLGTYVRRSGGRANWTGIVVGYYSTDITPRGYAIESILERGSVQIYSEAYIEEVPSEDVANILAATMWLYSNIKKR